MKRTLAAVITVVTASTSMWLAAAGAASAAPVAPAGTVAAAHVGPKPPVAPGATLRVVPRWTYQHGGKIAVIADPPRVARQVALSRARRGSPSLENRGPR